MVLKILMESCWICYKGLFMSTLCVLFVSVINSKFFLVSLAEELKPTCPCGKTFSKSDPGVSAHQHPYPCAGAVPAASHAEVPNLVLHLPYIHHQRNICTNSLPSICFILSLESNNWQVKSLLVWSCLQSPVSFFSPSSIEALRSLSLCYNWT